MTTKDPLDQISSRSENGNLERREWYDFLRPGVPTREGLEAYQYGDSMCNQWDIIWIYQRDIFWFNGINGWLDQNRGTRPEISQPYIKTLFSPQDIILSWVNYGQHVATSADRTGLPRFVQWFPMASYGHKFGDIDIWPWIMLKFGCQNFRVYIYTYTPYTSKISYIFHVRTQKYHLGKFDRDLTSWTHWNGEYIGELSQYPALFQVNVVKTMSCLPSPSHHNF